MACCTGQTECNHIVTIGYLKTLIGNNVQDNSGAVVSVNYSDNTYCPTYAELTGGTIIQNHKNGSGGVSDDIDGIVVGGSYTSLQRVLQEDLSLIYTRWKSFSIGATPTTISECGGNSTLSYSHKYTRTTVKLNSSCVSATTNTEVSDTQNGKVSWNAGSYGSISFPTYTIDKNGSVSAASRSTTITATVTFRGTNHSDTVTITQNALSGDYTTFVEDKSSTAYNSFSLSPKTFDCDGGIAVGTGNFTVTSWKVYSYTDSCGVNYPSITTNKNTTTTSSSETVNYTVSAVTCGSEEYTLTKTETWHGLSDSWTQTCEACPCSCDYFLLTQTTTVQQSASTYQIIGTYELGCVEDNLSWDRYSSSSSQYISWKDEFTWDENAIWKSVEEEIFVVNDMYFSGGNIYVYPYENSGSNSRTETVEVSGSYYDYTQGTNVTCTKLFTITQNGLAPVTCDTQSCTCYKVGNATASVNATATSATVTFPYTAITWTTASTCDVSSASTTGSSSQTVTFAASTCDNYSKSGSFTWTNHKTCGTNGCGSNDVTVNWYVTQTKPSDCCGCGDFSIDTSSLSWSYNSTTAKIINITSGSCISSISVNTLTYFNVSVGSDKITVTPKENNTSASDHDETLTISFNAKGSSCTSQSVSLTQYAPPCQYSQCTCYEVSEATLKNGTSISSGATSAEVEWSYTAMTYTTNYDCTTSGYESSTGTSSTTITGIATNNTCSDIVRNGSFTWNGYTECYSNDCGYSDATIYWNVTQNRGKEATDPECTGCYCSGFTLGSYPSAWTCSSTSTQYVYYTGSCQTQITASSNGTHFSASADTSNNRIVVYPNSINNTNARISETITVSYYANGSSCPNKTFQVNHESGSTCYCPDNCDSITSFSITKSSLEASGATSWVEIGSYGYNSACSDKVDVESNKTWLSVSAHSGTVYGKWDANTSFTDTRSATITAKWGTTSCTSRTGSVTQEKVTCNCTTANFQIDPTSITDIFYDDNNFYVQYTADCGSVSATVVSGSDWITGITVYNDEVEFGITENTSTANTRSGSVKLFLVGNESCSASTTVTQGKAPCDCTTSNFNVDTTTKNISSGASTLAATIKYSADCGTVSATVVSGGDWITGLSVYQSSVYHDVDLKVTANNGPERSGSVKVYLVGYESSCSDIVPVVQAPGSTPCPTITITPNNSSGHCSGGTVTFTKS